MMKWYLKQPLWVKTLITAIPAIILIICLLVDNVIGENSAIAIIGSIAFIILIVAIVFDIRSATAKPFYSKSFTLDRDQKQLTACRQLYWDKSNYGVLRPRIVELIEQEQTYTVSLNGYILGTLPSSLYNEIKENYSRIRRITVDIEHDRKNYASVKEEDDYKPHVTIQIYSEKGILQNPTYQYRPRGRRISYAESKELREYVVIDIETTGLNPDADDIIEVAALHIDDGKIVNSFSEFVSSKNITPESTKQNHITTKDVAQAREVHAVLADYAAFIGNLPIVGHNVSFDLDFINAIHPLSNPIEDTCTLARELLYEQDKQIENCKLPTVCAFFKIDKQTDHRALEDCKATFQCYEQLKAYIPIKKKRTEG